MKEVYQALDEVRNEAVKRQARVRRAEYLVYRVWYGYMYMDDSEKTRLLSEAKDILDEAYRDQDTHLVFTIQHEERK